MKGPIRQKKKKTKIGRTERESGEFLGECMEWNTVERAIKTETYKRAE